MNQTDSAHLKWILRMKEELSPWIHSFDVAEVAKSKQKDSKIIIFYGT